jgi:hypothetical protein
MSGSNSSGEKVNAYNAEHIDDVDSPHVGKNPAGLAIELEEGKDLGLSAAHLCSECMIRSTC